MANRYFVASLPAAGTVQLDGELAHHLGRVLRVRAGDRVVLGDGRGGTALATVVRADRDAVVCDVGAPRSEPPPRPRLVVAFAVPRLQRAEWLLEHGTEIGIAAFQPLATARSRPQGERAERWQRIVRGAAGQCDRAWLPDVLPFRELDDWLREPSLPARRWVGDGAAATALGDGADRDAADGALLVGPEGGFTDGERAAIAAAGFAPRRFGAHVLRTETAALVGAALLLAR
jgi:16S rRNA (uracil1498-N3)-methyltransferase